jgi:hypothetical protein
MPDEVREPTPQELDWIRRAEERINRYLYRYYFDEDGEGRLDHTEGDLRKAQEVFDNEEFTADQLIDLQCLGAVLGNIFVDQTPMRWMVVTNEFGTNLALRHPDTGFVLYPLSMISKRVEDGREIDIPALHESFFAIAQTGGRG